MKVDVEGLEAKVFRGAARLLQRKAIEYIHYEMLEILAAMVGETRDTTIVLLEAFGYTSVPPASGDKNNLIARPAEKAAARKRAEEEAATKMGAEEKRA